MRDLLSTLIIVILLGGTAHAQTPSAAWSVVEGLPEGTALRVHAMGRSLTCALVTADDRSLTCRLPFRLFAGQRNATFARAEISWIKGSRKELSTLVGGGIGLGAGLGAGAGVDAASASKEDGHLATAVLGLLGFGLGLAVGKGTDFLAGPVLYRAN